MEKTEKIVKAEFKMELQKIVHCKCAEINHYIAGCDSPFSYLQIAEVQDKLNEIEEVLGCCDD